MSITYFPWNDVGQVNELTVIDISHTIKHEFGGGYQASRAAATKMQKEFKLSWKAMSSTQWYNLLVFWRSVRGSANAFYFEYPIEVYGGGAWGGGGTDEPPDGFDYEGEFGQKPQFLARFVEDSLVQKLRTDSMDRWEISLSVREVS